MSVKLVRLFRLHKLLFIWREKEKKFTHKSLALAMATRHITGSVKLVEILHGLGHCVSPVTVYKHDSALALSCNSCNQDVIIPRNIIPGSFSTIV